MIVADCTWFRNSEKDEVISKWIDYLNCYRRKGILISRGEFRWDDLAS